jgi:hypothetical protein
MDKSPSVVLSMYPQDNFYQTIGIKWIFKNIAPHKTHPDPKNLSQGIICLK